MITAWHWIAGNADWLSALSGLLSAFVLAWPLVADLPKRLRQDVIRRIGLKPPPPAKPWLGNDSGALKKIEAGMIRDRMGGYVGAARTVTIGLGLLALSFVFSLIYALGKA